ncbi:hypothetical protein D3C71_1245950 [compost metagenome]
MDIVGGAAALVNFPDEIEKARVHPRRLVATPVAQQPVGLRKALLVKPAIALVGNRCPLARMGEVQLQRPVFRKRHRGSSSTCGKRENHGAGGLGDGECRICGVAQKGADRTLDGSIRQGLEHDTTRFTPRSPHRDKRMRTRQRSPDYGQ